MLERDDENLAKKRANKEKIREFQQAINTLHDDNESIDEDRIKQRIIYVLCGFFKEKQQQLNQKDFEKALAMKESKAKAFDLEQKLTSKDADVLSKDAMIGQLRQANDNNKATLTQIRAMLATLDGPDVPVAPATTEPASAAGSSSTADA